MLVDFNTISFRALEPQVASPKLPEQKKTSKYLYTNGYRNRLLNKLIGIYNIIIEKKLQGRDALDDHFGRTKKVWVLLGSVTLTRSSLTGVSLLEQPYLTWIQSRTSHKICFYRGTSSSNCGNMTTRLMTSLLTFSDWQCKTVTTILFQRKNTRSLIRVSYDPSTWSGSTV